MKEFILLFLMLSAPALAADTDAQTKARQFAEGKAFCAARNPDLTVSEYWQCVHSFILDRYGWEQTTTPLFTTKASQPGSGDAGR